MESNKEEAKRCLAIARKHKEAGNFPSALKFCRKSVALFETDEGRSLLKAVEAAMASSSEDAPTTSSSTSTETHPSASGARHRHTAAPSSSGSSKSNGKAGGMNGDKRDYTPEQHGVVKRVRACKVTEYYEILDLKKDCEEAEIKKAYRKLALALHPDKNGAPGADEAFKMVSKAFQVLSDADKRAVYDRSGGDPEDRYAGMPSRASGFGGGPFGNGNGMAFESELSPEDLFNMFFGGGGMAGGNVRGFQFGGPGVFTASFGPGGFRTTGGRTHQHARQNNERAEPRNVLLQLLPLFVLFFISFFSSLPSLFSSSPSQVPDPHFSFNPTQRYSVQRYTSKYGVAYWVDPKEFLSHPTIGSELAKNGETLTKWLDDLKQWKEWELREETADLKADQEAEAKEQKNKVVDPKNTPENRAIRRAVKAAMRRQQRVKSIARTSLPTLSQFEASVERIYSEELYAECRRIAERKERRKDAEVGIFGIGADWDKVRRIEAEAIESCEILRGLGILR
ncbi:DnaJ subfamily B/C chaperone co-factor [Pleurotus pulmonarius]